MKLKNSLVRRYFLVTLGIWGLSFVVAGLLYDRFVSQLLDQLVAERLNSQLAAAASRISAFFEGRSYEIDTLSNHPSLPGYLGAREPEFGSEIAELLRVEADEPDLYGILFLDRHGALNGFIAGQAASGAPYWPERRLELAGLPGQALAETQILGPVAPAAGQPGWFLMRQTLRGGRTGPSAGSIALHVRLASVTELLGLAAPAGILRPFLETPAGFFDTVGQPARPAGRLAFGPEILPGWRPVLEIDAGALMRPLQTARQGLYLALLVGAALTIVLFSRLAARLNRRLGTLSQGALAVAQGDFAHRVTVEGQDEIAVLADTFNTMAKRVDDMMSQAVRMERMAMLGEFATAVAHEVRNPLATMKSTVQALARGEADGERYSLLDDMGREIDRLGRVMQDLLHFGRPRQPQRAPLAVRELMRRTGSLMTPAAERVGVTLTVQGDGSLVLLADADQVQQALVNLLLNAIQASAPGGVVSLRAFNEAQSGVLEVCDNGCGIPPETLARVTEPFFTTKPAGTGLGLSISRQLAELNGGSLSIHSCHGLGTTVRLTLPQAGEEPCPRF
ncbi:MAG: HAMP domain-containing protein [Azospirillum sp.]|nr:HAMP domain-containing protein [Azospirillum sp.]